MKDELKVILRTYDADPSAVPADMFDKEVDEILKALRDRLLAARPEKKIPYWRSHKGDEIDHARAIGFDEAVDEYTAVIASVLGEDA
jgi:hypothetical protein